MSRRQIEAGILIAVVVLLFAILAPAIQSARQANRLAQSKNNLKQLGLALHNYHDCYRGLPPGGTFHADGRPHHGWMTSIMPFMDASPVYTWIDFDQPWEFAANAGIFVEAHMAYQSPRVPTKVGSWEYYPAHYSANDHLMGPNSFTRIEDIPAKSGMLLVGELRSEFVPWGCPFNFRTLESPIGRDAYGSPDQSGWIVLLADGNVREISDKIAPELVRTLSGPNLSITDKAPKKIQRPNHFTVPSDALKRRFYRIENDQWQLDFIDKSGQVVRSDKCRGK